MDRKKYDLGQPDWSILPYDRLEFVVRVLDFGARKYGRDNWKDVPNADTRYFAAAMRHMVAHHSGNPIDDESGLPHLAHAVASLLFMMQPTKLFPPE